MRDSAYSACDCASSHETGVKQSALTQLTGKARRGEIWHRVAVLPWAHSCAVSLPATGGESLPGED